MANFDAYVLCTTPRSGSTMLCHMLRATGIAGHPESWFHQPSVESWRAALGLGPGTRVKQVIVAAIGAGRAESDIFGLRVQRGSFDFLQEQLADLYPAAQTDLDRLEAAFGRVKFIYLSREDRVAQAVSLVRADQTGLWHRRADGRELERLAVHKDPVFDRIAIANALDHVNGLNDAWDRWFAAQDLSPLRIIYERLATEPQRVLAEVLEKLGLVGKVAAETPVGTARLADDISEDWINRFSR
ncbi:MAG: Stf0 family sulfotransferase [Pseudomonadota bacterium]